MFPPNLTECKFELLLGELGEFWESGELALGKLVLANLLFYLPPYFCIESCRFDFHLHLNYGVEVFLQKTSCIGIHKQLQWRKTEKTWWVEFLKNKFWVTFFELEYLAKLIVADAYWPGWESYCFEFCGNPGLKVIECDRVQNPSPWILSQMLWPFGQSDRRNGNILLM